MATRKKASALGRVTLGRKKRRASVEILTLGLRDCKECRLGEKGRALLLAARAQVGKRHKGMGVSVQVYNRGLRLLALREKNFKRALACAGVGARRC